MYISQLTDGSLQMVADPHNQKLARKITRIKCLCPLAQEAAFIAHVLTPKYEQTSPASVGAFTSAPLITDGINIWGYMDYQVSSFLERLADGKDVIWQKG